MRARAVLVSCMVLLAARRAGADDAVRCGGALVTPGDAALDLLARCGPPAIREERVVERAVVVANAASSGASEVRRDTRIVERWTYNFGPGRLIAVVTIDGGKVRRVERGGYGYPPERLGSRAAGASRCDGDVRVGDLTLDVLARCGEPALRDRAERERDATAEASGGDGWVAWRERVAVETWTYDLGSERLMLLVTLEDGKVASVERGGYGYAR
jgi:hypothetical protein